MLKQPISILFTVLILLSPLSINLAAGGVIQLPQSGQTSCYDTAGVEISCAGTGQDGNKRAGVAWPNPRFSVSGDCITDNLTGLMWSRDGNLSGMRTWQGALDWVDSLNSGGGLCGYSDWRLPNRKELKSLVNRQKATSDVWLNSQGFNTLQDNWYWSSSTNASNTLYAWIVAINNGFVGSSHKTDDDFNYVWPVRAGQ